MDETDTYGQIVKLIDELSDDELYALLSYVRTFAEARAHMAKYDPAKDSIVTGEGLFEGPPDLSERVEDILYPEDTPATEADEQIP